MKIVTILGARPQFIKAAVVSKALIKANIKEIIVHTGQHYDREMSDIFFDEMAIPEPDYSLNIGSASHGKQTGKMLEAIEEVIEKEHPGCIIVYGDTNSTLAGALAAAKLHIPVFHIEAGLRSFNKRMPEEVNRILTDHISDLLFCPSETSRTNLLQEGITKEKICVVGDVMYDTVIEFLELAQSQSKIIEQLKLVDSEYILATIHRAENTNDLSRLESIVEALCVISRHAKVVLPVHPRTKSLLSKININLESYPNLNLINPVGYLDMLLLEKNSRIIVTDSGGMQKEAYFHQTPCVTLRDETEWTELVAAGVNFIVGADKEAIVKKVLYCLENDRFDFGTEFYGAGNASDLIVERIEMYLSNIDNNS